MYSERLQLTVEDEEYVKSNSVTNQRLLIQKYLCDNPEFSDYEIREYSEMKTSGTFGVVGSLYFFVLKSENKIWEIIFEPLFADLNPLSLVQHYP